MKGDKGERGTDGLPGLPAPSEGTQYIPVPGPPGPPGKNIQNNMMTSIKSLMSQMYRHQYQTWLLFNFEGPPGPPGSTAGHYGDVSFTGSSRSGNAYLSIHYSFLYILDKLVNVRSLLADHQCWKMCYNNCAAIKILKKKNCFTFRSIRFDNKPNQIKTQNACTPIGNPRSSLDELKALREMKILKETDEDPDDGKFVLFIYFSDCSVEDFPTFFCVCALRHIYSLFFSFDAWLSISNLLGLIGLLIIIWVCDGFKLHRLIRNFLKWETTSGRRWYVLLDEP